jgi:glycosyltransferase involved in cell wall biosynthesis
MGDNVEQTEYLLVVQAPCYRVDEKSFATESAFAEHLRVLQKKLAPRFKRLWVAAPQFSDQFYRDNRGHLGQVIESQDHIYFIPLQDVDVSAWAFWTKQAPRVWRTLRERTKRSRIVHCGLLSVPWRPMPLMANIAAKLDGCKVLFVVDIDFRKAAWRYWKSGQWSFKSFILCKLVYDQARLAHMYFATRTSALSLLKSVSMVRDFGRGRPNVRFFWDTAHSIEQVIDSSELEARLTRLANRDQPISLIYFGRFVAYKGIDRMIRAVWQARRTSGRAFVLDLVGSGDELNNLRALVKELGAEEAVRFHDPLPYGEQLFAKIREADLMLATPVAEDTPRAAFDAMAAGIPILAFDIDYFVSLAKESNAVVTARWPDVDAIAEQIVSLDIDRERLNRMSHAALQFARANTQEIWIDRRVAWTLATLDDGR